MEQMSRAGFVHGRNSHDPGRMEEYAEALAGVSPRDRQDLFPLRRLGVGRSGLSRWPSTRWIRGRSNAGASLPGGTAITAAPCFFPMAHRIRKPYLPMLVNFPHFPPPYCYRCPSALQFPQCGLECAKALEKMIQMEGPPALPSGSSSPGPWRTPGRTADTSGRRGSGSNREAGNGES